MVWERTGVYARIKSAMLKGWTASKWISAERKKERSYKESIMYSDWAEVATIIKHEGALARIRRGRVPIDRMAELEVWDMSAVFMYKVKTERISPTGEELTPKYVNIMSDEPMTIEEIEREAFVRAFDQSPPEAGEEREFIVETAIKRKK